jgi:hypothetical protein
MPRGPNSSTTFALGLASALGRRVLPVSSRRQLAPLLSERSTVPLSSSA